MLLFFVLMLKCQVPCDICFFRHPNFVFETFLVRITQLLMGGKGHHKRPASITLEKLENGLKVIFVVAKRPPKVTSSLSQNMEDLSKSYKLRNLESKNSQINILKNRSQMPHGVVLRTWQ